MRQRTLQANIPLLLDQEYPEFEIVVVNDGSFDESELILDEYEQVHNNFKQLVLKDDPLREGGKRGALKYGILAAKYDLLLLTDADCKPGSKHWIAEMTESLEDKEIVLGIGLLNTDNTLVGNLVRYETCLTYMQYISAAIEGMPYMGVGRNLLYHKNLFKKGLSGTATGCSFRR